MRLCVIYAACVAALFAVPACEGRKAAERGSPTAVVVPDGHLVGAASVERVLREGIREQWYGMYLRDKKVGYASVRIDPAVDGRVLWAVSGRLRSSSPDGSMDASFSEERLYAAEPPYILLEIRAREETGAGVVERVYRNQPDGMTVTLTTAGAPSPERRIAASRETLLGVLDQSAIEPAEVKAGMTAAIPEFDSSSEVDEPTTVKVVEVRRERLAGVETQVAVLSSQAEGEQAITQSFIASGGVTLRASLGQEITLRAEEKARAQSDVVGFDMIGDAVRIDRPLGDPSALRQLRLVVGVASNFALRDAPNQEITRRPDGKLDVAIFSRPGLPVLPDERGEALQTTSAADAGHPAVAELAARLVAGAADREQQVARLVDWVFENLRKDLSTNLTTASQVLDRRTGDCSEHALLFVALARAAGIPAREVSGLVYMGDEVRRFGWHAWAEVDLGGRWVQVDPSWGEHVANATHLALGVGDNSDWVMTMGSLTISLAP
jgi:hypothetical protein